MKKYRGFPGMLEVKFNCVLKMKYTKSTHYSEFSTVLSNQLKGNGCLNLIN